MLLVEETILLILMKNLVILNNNIYIINIKGANYLHSAQSRAMLMQKLTRETTQRIFSISLIISLLHLK